MAKSEWWRTAWPFMLGILLLLGAGGLWLASIATNDAEVANTSRVNDMNGRAVALEDPITDPVVIEEMDAVEDDGERLTVDSVGLDVPLGSLDMVDGEITPPGFTSAYVVRNMGTPDDPAAGTTYVVMHSIPSPGEAPGNYLIDVDGGEAAVEEGTEVRGGNETFVVDSTMTLAKGDLPGSSEVWEQQPGRLVLITCQQRPSGERSVANTVIEAHLVTS